MDILNDDYVARTAIAARGPILQESNAILYNLDDIYVDIPQDNKYNGTEIQFYPVRNTHKIYNTSYVIRRFYCQYPYFKGIDLSNLYIAGGAISQFIKHKFISPDIDVFVYGLTVEQANIRVVKFINDIELNISTKHYLIKNNGYGADTWIVANLISNTDVKYSHDLKHFILSKTSQINDDEWNLFITLHTTYYPHSSIISANSVRYKLSDEFKVHSVITDYSLTVDFGESNTKIQVISRLYKTKQEILYGFDLGSCAVGFDGKLVEFSIAGKFAQEYNLNILDTTRFSLNHGARLKKYFDRGYGIIFPLCKPITDTSNITVVRFYNMSFKYSINANRNQNSKRNYVQMYTNSSGSDYGCDHATATETAETIYLKNTIFKLANGHRGFYIYNNITKVKQFSTMFTRLPTINIAEIEKFYKYMHNTVWKNGCLDMKLITSYIPEFDFAEFASIVKTRSGSPGKYIQDCSIKQFDNIQKKIDLLGIDENPQEYIGIKWTTSDVMSQKSLLTGSFHPVYMDNKRFYTNKYYSEERAEFLISTIP